MSSYSPPQVGYDYAWVDTPDEDLICCICQLICRDPTETPCSHLYCHNCIRTWLQTNPTCALDRTPLRIQQLHPSAFARRKIESLRLTCPYQCTYNRLGSTAANTNDGETCDGNVERLAPASPPPSYTC